MFSIRALVRPVAVAVAFALTAAPAAALAEGKNAGAETKKERPQFPMTAESFNKHLEKRIAHARERLERALTDHKVPAAVQAQVKKDFDDGTAAVRALASKATSDGTVTKEEAKQVKDLAKDLKNKAREKYGIGKGKGKGKGKDKKVAA